MAAVSPIPAAIAPMRTRARRLTAVVSRRLATTTYLRKWLFLGALIGVVAGLGAVLFYNALTLATHLFLGILGNYHVPTPIGEGSAVGSPSFLRAWAIPLIVALGGLLSGLLVYTLAPEAEGHGTDAAISAVHENPRGIRLRAVLVKIVASALTIGSGGSGGREGPTAQISAGFGSLLARLLDLSPADARIAVTVGIGSGIGAIFGAPLGGAVLAAEILYRDDLEVDALIPAFIASIVAYSVFSAFQGFAPLFGFVGGYAFTDSIQLAWFAIIGVVGGVVGLAYAKGFYGIAALFGRIRIPPHVKPAIGGLLVGLLALKLPGVLGTGYGWVQRGLGHDLLAIPLWMVLAMPFARILATGCSIGSGGSGGIFGPGMVIGAYVGAAAWRVLEPIAPAVPHNPASFVVVGMMACFGSIARAPLAVMLMVAEMTGTLSVLAPAMVAVGIATLIVRRGDDTIYRSQLKNREAAPAYRLRAGMPLLSSVRVEQTMVDPRLVLDARQEAHQALERLQSTGVSGAPVTDESGLFIGVVRAGRVAEQAKSQPDTPIGNLVDPTVPRVVVGSNLATALEALMTQGSDWATVLDEDRKVVGVLATSDLVRGYRAALRTNLRLVSQVAPHTASIDEQIGARSPLVGRSLQEAALPQGTIVMTLQRGAELMTPRGDTVLEEGDRIGILVQASRRDEVDRLVRGEHGDEEPADAGSGEGGSGAGPDGGTTEGPDGGPTEGPEDGPTEEPEDQVVAEPAADGLGSGVRTADTPGD